MINRTVCFVLIFAVAALGADDQVRSTQEELRRRNVYFGDIDGRRSEEYSEALRRYQKRKGLAGFRAGRPRYAPLAGRAAPLAERTAAEGTGMAGGARAEKRRPSGCDRRRTRSWRSETGVAPVRRVAPPEMGAAQPSEAARGHAARFSSHLRAALGRSGVEPPSRALPARLSFRNSAAIPSELNELRGPIPARREP
jgi:hypothetical protein